MLTLAFHGNGRWLLSGAADHVVNLWLVPDLEDFSKDADDPFVIHFPHFSTSQIHTNYVDSLCFHHDLIVSKCANDDKVVLWKITGFSSADRPPEYHACPTKHERAPTISAFGPGYERLMQLRHSKLRPYFMRFGFVNTHDDRAMLALGMADGEVSFWDLSRLDEHESTATSRRGASIADPFAGVEPLAVISTPHRSFHISQVAYSADGKWMAAVGTRPAGVAIFAIS